MHDVDVHIRRASARVSGRAPAGKARACEIESSPKELDGARFAEEVCPEAIEDELRSDQNALKPFHLLAVVGADLEVVREWDNLRDFDRDRHDARVTHAELGKAFEYLLIEMRDRHRKERDR